MSFADRNNPYSFNDFLAWRQGVDYYADDPFIQKVVRHYTGDTRREVDAEARAVSEQAGTQPGRVRGGWQDCRGGAHIARCTSEFWR